ncbi:MAG: preprotein translocase subunit SecF [Candidatus Berkelbacteria bacterium Licking1014_7]|uniref:Protein-export membrane protein SecF n=1 Tax=Candidatus Berkelbacteria bacterium Licking1014_7 TaxID=2017147 RepID=A0A554LK36_9BACT|nr:MAG: preprotein translocase subunit SecF [Candidatus Berkelbacteria bacterium Licking1014_7]
MNLLGRKKIWYLAISGIIILTGIISLLIFKLRLGIDFVGGSIIEIETKQNTNFSNDKIKQALADKNIENLSIYQIGEGGWVLKMKEIDENKKNEIINAIKNKVGESEERRFETVGPTVSQNLRQKSIFAIILAMFAIIFYIALAFRRLPKFLSPWKFGISAIIALVHDLLIVLGAFSILSHFWGYEIDSMFITALLTILGFSVHDTIVVFDRIRENFHSNSPYSGLDIESVANYSLVQTMGRSLNTSLTIILVLIVMLTLGGNTIQPFIVAMLIGMITGTYSSIFIATPILVFWHRK